MATLSQKTDEIAALESLKKDLAKFEMKQAKATKADVKLKIAAKIKGLRAQIKAGKTKGKDVSAKQLANSLLRSRKKFLEMSKKDFNGVIRQLSKKPEYSFLKGMSRTEVINDINRKAKPVGWRFKGRNNYKTPTKEQVRKGRANGTVYYENRPNRSDVSQARQLAKGGSLKGHGLAIGDEIVNVYRDDVYVYNRGVVYMVDLSSGKRTMTKMSKDDAISTFKDGGEVKEDPQVIRYYFEDDGYEYEKGGSSYAEGGSMASGGVLTKAELKLNIYEPSGDYYMEKKGGKIILHLTSKDASNLPPSFFERYNVEDNGKGYYGTSYIVSKKTSYAEGGEIYEIHSKHKDGSDSFEVDSNLQTWNTHSDAKKQADQLNKDSNSFKYKVVKKSGSTYEKGGEIDINDIEIPVHYTMFEEEMYEYGKGGIISVGDNVTVRSTGQTMEVSNISKNRSGQVEFTGSKGTFLIGGLKKN